MAEKPYFFMTDANGVRMCVDRATGKRTPVDDVVRQAAERGDLVTMEQAMSNEHYGRDMTRVDTLEEV